MSFKLFSAAAALAACVVLAGNSGWSFLPQDEKDAGKKPTQDEMAKIKAAAEPGDVHKKLAKLEGTWDQKTINEAEGMSSTGTVRYRPILGGRFVVAETKAVMKMEAPGGNGNGAAAATELPYESFQQIGYDNVTKKHVTTYSSTMCTGIFTAEGTADASGKIITYDGTMKDVFTPQGRPFRVVVNCETDDKTTIELWDSKGGKPLAKSCTITETRQK
jgi:hypothetical protein